MLEQFVYPEIRERLLSKNPEIGMFPKPIFFCKYIVRENETL